MTKVVYSEETRTALHKDLLDILKENNVQNEVAEWFVGKGILRIEAFADLADTKTYAAQRICEPAGLNKDDHAAVQPTRTAWRQAEAIYKAALESQAKGESDMLLDKPLKPDTRIRMDEEFKEYHHFMFPPVLDPDRCLPEQD